MRNLRVSIEDGIVAAYHKKLNMISFHKITQKNKVSKGVHLPTVVADDFAEAVRRANQSSPERIIKAHFREVRADIKKCLTWDEYVEQAWQNARI